MSIYRRLDHTAASFFRRTVAAQIHTLAVLLVCIGMVTLLPKAAAAGPEHFWACLVFLVTGLLLFLASSIYHFLFDGYQISNRLELFLEDFDHYCIYLFIAGSYTPVLINSVGHPWRMYLLIAVWTIAALGILYTRLRPHLFPVLRSRAMYTSLFVLLGFLFVIRTGEVYSRLSALQLVLLLGGVMAYLGGAVGYATRRPVLVAGIFGYHELWHVMVLLGAVLHFFCIYSFYGLL